MVSIPMTSTSSSIRRPEHAPHAMNRHNNQREDHATRELFRVICRLSGACARDANVLRDGQLVDSLEHRAKEILHARQLRGKVSKRRKLPVDAGAVVDRTNAPNSPAKYVMPRFFSSIHKPRSEAPKEMAKVSSQGATTLIPGIKISKINRRESTTRRSHSPNNVDEQRQVDTSGATSPTERLALDRSFVKPGTESVDLGASMVSTESSSSMPHYDMSDMDEFATLSPMAKCSSPEFSDLDYMTPLRQEDCDSAMSTEGNDSMLDVSELSSNDHKRTENRHSSPVTPKRLGFDADALSLLENDPIDEVGHATVSLHHHEDSVIETLQSQVDLLVAENSHAAANSARLTEQIQMSMCDAEAQTGEKRHAIAALNGQMDHMIDMEHRLRETELRAEVQECCRRQAEVAFQTELDSKSELLTSLQQELDAKDQEIERLTKRVEDVSALFAAKVREVERRRLSLSSRMESVSPTKPSALAILAAFSVDPDSTQSPDRSDDDLIMSLRESNLFKDMEMEKMRSTLLEKDREICHLYMHLSTKKKLIEEITRKFVEHMESAGFQKGGPAAECNDDNRTQFPVAAESVRFDLDMFLFKNVVDKQRRMEELTAALGVMDREVESLEGQVAEKERENTQLRENQDILTKSLETVNAQVCRMQAENERLNSSLNDKQSRITELIASLEEKERQITHLGEQAALHQSQLDNSMSDNAQRQSLTSNLFKRSSSASMRRNSASSPASSREATSTVFSRSFASASLHRTSAGPEPVSGGSFDWSSASASSLMTDANIQGSEVVKRRSTISDLFNEIDGPSNMSDPLLDDLFDTDHELSSNRASYCESVTSESIGVTHDELIQMLRQ